MMKIVPIDSAQNIYENNRTFRLIREVEVLLEGRTVHKLTYRETTSLVWKIAQVAIAVLMTLMTLGMAMCVFKGVIWKEALAQFKDRIVYQKVPDPLTPQASIQPKPPLNAGPISLNTQPPLSPKNALPPVAQVQFTPIPVLSPQVTPVPAPVQPPLTALATPALIPAPLSPTDIACKKEIALILQTSPEFRNAVEAWEKNGIALQLQVSRLQRLREYTFGSEKWAAHVGSVVGLVPPLPADIFEICDGPDVYDSGALTKDTHVLVLVPEAVRFKGKLTDLTLENVGSFAVSPQNSKNWTPWGNFSPYNKHASCEKTHWAMMRKTLIPGSRNQTFAKQQELVQEYSKKAKSQYIVLNLVDATTCMLMHFISTGNRLFDTGPDGVTFTRCQETNKHHQAIVGKFDEQGPWITYLKDHQNIGIAPVRLFF